MQGDKIKQRNKLLDSEIKVTTHASLRLGPNVQPGALQTRLYVHVSHARWNTTIEQKRLPTVNRYLDRRLSAQGDSNGRAVDSVNLSQLWIFLQYPMAQACF